MDGDPLDEACKPSFIAEGAVKAIRVIKARFMRVSAGESESQVGKQLSSNHPTTLIAIT
jgi:hypothetical protein